MSEFRRRLMIYGKAEDNVVHNIVSYIQANGKSYISLPFVPNEKTRIVMKLNRPSPSDSGPIYYATNGSSRFLAVRAGELIYFSFGSSNKGANYLAVPWGNYTFDTDLPNDTIKTTTSKKISDFCPEYKNGLKDVEKIKLFYRNDTNVYCVNTKVFYVKIYDDGVLTYDLKPFDDGDKNGLVNILNNKTYTDVNGFLFKTSINP